jgi:hypothetical protein
MFKYHFTGNDSDLRRITAMHYMVSCVAAYRPNAFGNETTAHKRTEIKEKQGKPQDEELDC